ncbi:MAG: hypothetical protein IKU48_00990 [Clostridia bacterium]|nr:hypothetical protein [Clostridia bacterium]
MEDAAQTKESGTKQPHNAVFPQKCVKNNESVLLHVKPKTEEDIKGGTM